jgi:hypothetical protein
MNDKVFRTEYARMPGQAFVFLTLGRPVSHDELEDLCVKYFDEHKYRTKAGEALEVDLRPAFQSPISDVTDVQFRSVPLE